MENKSIYRLFRPIFLIFIVLSMVFAIGSSVLASLGIDYRVLLGGNILLFAVTTVSFLLYVKGLGNKNVHAFVRVMYGSLLVKLMVCLLAVLVYAAVARAAVNRNGVFGCFILYVLYTWLEVRILLRLMKKASNA
jgi:hypothetical protein